VRINAQYSEARPALFFTPSFIETGVARNNIVTETVTLENKGLADMRNIQLSLSASDGGAVPTWIQLNSAESQGTLAVGERREIRVSFSPTDSVAEGYHHYYLKISAANHPDRSINMFASVTQSGLGDVIFKVTDIYTGTLDGENNPIPGLAGARIRVQNELVLTEEYNKTTDNLGETEFSDLPVGRYKYRIQAKNHQTRTGRFWVRPGLTASP
ncbi:MAG: hypothetical protein GY859_12780, partial [Desulfobacterales bacterium]|nr:hypothetical protein [Desulfobacterales bacterium]